jgi:hypothetical protein
LVELSRGEYASKIMMLTKKNILVIGLNDTCGDYYLMNKWTWLDKYVIPLPKEILDQWCHLPFGFKNTLIKLGMLVHEHVNMSMSKIT